MQNFFHMRLQVNLTPVQKKIHPDSEAPAILS